MSTLLTELWHDVTHATGAEWIILACGVAVFGTAVYRWLGLDVRRGRRGFPVLPTDRR